MAEEKTFKVHCDHCEKPFHVRFPLVSDEDGEANVVVNCLYCREEVVVRLPRRYVEKEHLLRGIQSHARK